MAAWRWAGPTNQLKACLLAGVCFSRRAVSFSRENFCSRFICSTDWALSCWGTEGKLVRYQSWKLGQRSLGGLEPGGGRGQSAWKSHLEQSVTMPAPWVRV